MGSAARCDACLSNTFFSPWHRKAGGPSRSAKPNYLQGSNSRQNGQCDAQPQLFFQPPPTPNLPTFSASSLPSILLRVRPPSLAHSSVRFFYNVQLAPAPVKRPQLKRPFRSPHAFPTLFTQRRAVPSTTIQRHAVLQWLQFAR